MHFVPGVKKFSTFRTPRTLKLLELLSNVSRVLTANLHSLFHMNSVLARTNGVSDIEACKIILLKCQPVSRPFLIMQVKLAFYAPSNSRFTPKIMLKECSILK